MVRELRVQYTDVAMWLAVRSLVLLDGTVGCDDVVLCSAVAH